MLCTDDETVFYLNTF